MEVAALLAAFQEATGREAAIWLRPDSSTAASLLASSSPTFTTMTASGVDAWDVPRWARQHSLVAQLITTGERVGWLLTETGPTEESDRVLGRLVPVVSRLERERDGAVRSLSERVDEITLLYTIGDMLGNGVSVEDVADTLLRELAATVGASRAVFLSTRRHPSALTPIATLGLVDQSYPSVTLDETTHIAVHAWRSGGACLAEGAAARLADPCLAQNGGPLLAVAVTRPSSGMGITGQYPAIGSRRPEGVSPEEVSGVPLGVIILGGRADGAPFTSGDRTLALAVGRQVGVAMHNMSLVRAAVERSQHAREMRLAHDLQLKLLPKPTIVTPEARAAARVVPADSVGGDFYLLARLDRDRTGVLIGDVSGHGYQSALVMALALSAAAIHVQAAFDPSIAVEAVQRSLADELASTEMSLSLCYVVIDARSGELRFANAGHPHAFRLGADGHCERLPAVAPPIGFGESAIEECVMSWRLGDRLVLFTDGVVDALDAGNRRLGERAMLRTLSGLSHGETPETILDAMFATVNAHADGTPLRDDLAIVVVDRPW